MRVVVPGVFAVLTACGNGGGNDTKQDAPDIAGFDRNVMLAHLSNGVLLPMQQAFAVKAAALPAAVETYCDAIEAGNIGATQVAANAAWGEAIDAWERAEAVLVGPGAMDNATLRSHIYSWPLVSACNLDRDTATLFNTPGNYDVNAKLVNARSLASIEYLLYKTDTAHSCLQEPVGWTATQPQLPLARCRLARILAADVAAQAVTLETAWRSDGGDFAGKLAKAGQSGTGFTSAHEAVNVVSDSLFYVDKQVKDMKIGETAGITENICTTIGEPCVAEMEHRLSDRATFAIRANLIGLREVFTGTATIDGPGFDDFLTAAGHPDVAARMTASLDAAITAATALPDSFSTALTGNYQDVVATHTAVKTFTDDLKSQFLTLLALEIPDDVATDND